LSSSLLVEEEERLFHIDADEQKPERTDSDSASIASFCFQLLAVPGLPVSFLLRDHGSLSKR
jgi:hypothetical protein